jgi:alcohol dehydrogenase, propanol-preferring
MNDAVKMMAMVLEYPGQPLKYLEVPIPEPGETQVLIKIQACGVCRTDLHIYDGELTQPKHPLIPGHEIIGLVEKVGVNVRTLEVGDWVGVPWLGSTCGECAYCKGGRENLCDNPGFTGYTLDGGYAQFAVPFAQYCFRLPTVSLRSVESAPLFCAGLIGYRSYRMVGEEVKRLGLFGFGAAAHILAQIAVQKGQDIYAFTSPGDIEKQEFARKLGAVWAGGSDEQPPNRLDAAIIFAPIGSLVPAALRVVSKGGIVVCGGIHMSDIPTFPYQLLWEERVVRSIANLTRQDGEEFLEVIKNHPVKISTQIYPLHKANEALSDLRRGKVQGAAVLVPSD